MIITDQLLKLIVRQASLVGGMSLQTIQMLLKLWQAYRTWTDYDLTLAQAARSATTVEAGMRAARPRQRAYMKFVYKELGIPFPTDNEIDQGLSVIIPGGVDIYPRGVNPLDVYQRPAEEYRYQLSTGLSDAEARQSAMDRLSTIADTDLTLARREEMRNIFQATPEVTGYRRVIHPEMSQDGTSCGLCVVASTRIYHKAELMPIHDYCNCDVLPIYDGNDPGNQINQDDLNALYQAAGGSNAAGDLLSTKVFFTEHGELGPIIAKNRQGAKQRARAKSPSVTPEESFTKQIGTLSKSVEKLKKRQAAGEDVRLAIQWQSDRINALTRQLAAMKRVRK